MTVESGPTGVLAFLFGLLVVLLLAGLAVFSVATVNVGVSQPASVASPPVPQYVGTPAAERTFPLPPGHAIVIDARVNSGSLPPPNFEVGYEITIDATGHTVITVTPPGANGAYAITPTAKQAITTRELGVAGLQRLLNQLDQGGYFRLQLLRSGPPRVGGPVSEISVKLANGSWDVDGATLSPSALTQLNRLQQLVAAAVGYQPPA